MLAALDNKENTNSNESHILNDFSCHRIYILYVTVSEKCEAHADEESKDNEKRQVTALQDKSECAMRAAAVQRNCGVNELAVWFIRR